MKILFVSNIFPPHVRGGYELGCQTIAQEMSKLGHEVCIASSVSPGYLNNSAPETALRVEYCFEPIFAYEEPLISALSHSHHWQKYQREAFGGVISGNAIALSRLLKEYQPDVTWIFNPLGLGPLGIFEAALTWPNRCLIHLMDDIDGMISHYSYPSLSHARLSRLKKYFNAISCSYKTMSTNEAQSTYRNHRVIYNGVDFTQFRPQLRPKQIDRTGRLRLVYFGQIEEAKGLSRIVRAADRAITQGYNFTIDLIGKGSPAFRSSLMDEIRDRNLQQVVNLVGFVNRAEMPVRLNQYDGAILLLSDREPFAYSVIEAMASGLPVILTSRSGNAECLPSNYPLLVEKRDNSDEVAGKIGWLCAHREQAKDLASRTTEVLKQFCDLKSVVLPSYLRTIRACPVNGAPFTLESCLSSFKTAEFNSYRY